MKKRDYLNKAINAKELIHPFEQDSYGENNSYERFLEDYNYEEADSRTGFNYFSIRLVINENKITEILRIAHCHMCGGQGTDRVVKVFPIKSLEAEASKVMNEVTNMK
jgi:hypothetical protein